MHRLLTPRWLRLAHRSSIIIPLLWWGLCYLFWIQRGCRPFLPFLSDFDLQEPEDTIFTVGVSLTCLILLVRMLQLYLSQSDQIMTLGLAPRWSLLNRFSLIPGTIGILSMAWLAQVPWNDDLLLHSGLADAIFGGGVLWCVCATALTWRRAREKPSLKRGLRWRLAGSGMAAVGLLGMRQTLAQATADSGSYNIRERILLSHDDPLTHCSDALSTAMNLAAAFEWLMIFGILFVTWTFASDLGSATEAES